MVNDQQAGDTPAVADLLPHLRLDELLTELESRLASVRATRDRVQELLNAVVAIGSGLDLDRVLHTIIGAAASLVDARYGALGVLGADRRLARFITVGLEPGQTREIGPYPTGKGILGKLVRDPEPLRLDDLTNHPASSGFPAHHPPMRGFLGVPIRVRDRVYGNLYLSEKRDGTFDADDEAVLTALAAAAGVAIDNARMYADARRRHRRLEATAELTRALLSGAGYREVLGLMAERASRLADADLVFIALPAPDAKGLRVEIAHGVGDDLIRGHAIPLEGTATGTVFRTATHVVLADATEVSFRDTLETCGLGPGPVLDVPIGAAGRTRGVLVLVRGQGGPAFDGDVARVVTDLAAQAAVMLELADRRTDAERLSVYAERDRIARDLHDLVIQRLFAIGVSLQGATRLGDRGELTARIGHAVDDIDETVEVIRSTILELSTREDGDGGDDGAGGSLRARVLCVCEQATAALGWAPAVRFTGPVDTVVRDETASANLLAVLREALANVARHAAARRADVEVSARDRMLSLRVADDGRGIDRLVAHRSGLTNMAERAGRLGGSFDVAAGEGGGTVVRWSVPLDGEAAGSGGAGA